LNLLACEAVYQDEPDEEEGGEAGEDEEVDGDVNRLE
jgi:hypothetical protein